MPRRLLIACLYAAGIGLGVLLLIQHWVHVPQFLPYLVFLACPLMHLFMHRGHGGAGHRHVSERNEQSRTSKS
jgi:Protein of unknown function (DUF2933)